MSMCIQINTSNKYIYHYLPFYFYWKNIPKNSCYTLYSKIIIQYKKVKPRSKKN